MEREPLVFAGVCDLSGHVRGKGFPATDLPSRLKNGVGFARSAIMMSAFGPIYETPFGTAGEVILLPDSTTRVHVDFPGSAPESFYLGDLITADGVPWDYCPRHFLRRALDDLKSESGLRLHAAFEQEFVFTAVDKEPSVGYSLDSFRRQGMFGEFFVSALRRAGPTPDSFLPEYAPRQFEVTTTPSIGVKAADDAVVTREMARAVAHRLGHRAIFAPMINPDGIGNGTHIHFSLWNGNPAMYDSAGFWELSDVGASFVAGVLHHLPALTAITASSVSSYFRLQPNRWAPTWANLGYLDRGASLRICPGFSALPENAARNFNVEYRVADAAACPYMVLGALVHAGVDGIRKKMKLPPLADDFGSWIDRDQLATGIARLPVSLCEALNCLAESEEAYRWFGEDFLRLYLQFKRSEIKALEGLEPAEICRRYAAVY